MALSQNMILWLSDRVREAEAVLASPEATPSQRSVARFILAQWSVI